LIFLAVFVCFFLVWKAIEWLRNRRSDGRAVEEGHREDPRFVHTLADIWHQTDEFPLTGQNRKQRKAIKERRKAREKAQKHQSQSYGAGALNQQRVPATPAEPITAQSRPVTKPHRRPAEPVGGDTVEAGHIKDPENDPLVNILFRHGPEGFSEREEEEFLLIHGPRKVRKAIRERRHARKQAQKKRSQS
jgi:hypothetical protein